MQWVRTVIVWQRERGGQRSFTTFLGMKLRSASFRPPGSLWIGGKINDAMQSFIFNYTRGCQWRGGRTQLTANFRKGGGDFFHQVWSFTTEKMRVLMLIVSPPLHLIPIYQKKKKIHTHNLRLVSLTSVLQKILRKNWKSFLGKNIVPVGSRGAN